MESLNIYLVGFMGCGKSVVGRALARRLRRAHIDSDAVIERSAGRTIAAIFRDQGETAFRRMEKSAVDRISRRKGVVASLGGGALLDPLNRKRLSKTGILVRLTCSEAELWRRLKPELPRRPLLAGGRSTLKSLLRARRGAYSGARWTLSTSRRSPDHAARALVLLLKAAGVR